METRCHGIEMQALKKYGGFKNGGACGVLCATKTLILGSSSSFQASLHPPTFRNREKGLCSKFGGHF